jgi:hypothetical protein
MFTKLVRANLLAIARAYRRATGKSWAQVSKEFYGNGTFFQQLQAGKRKGLSTQSVDRMRDKFDAKWPENVPRPIIQPIDMSLGSPR